MRCSTAREYFYRNRDGMLDEAGRMRLQEHLNECPACAEFCGEMEGCLDLLGDLEELEVSESFEWNVKRRIAMEKSQAMRRGAGAETGAFAWGSRFVAAAAATVVLALAGAWLLGGGKPVEVASGTKPVVHTEKFVSPGRYGETRFTQTGYPAGIQYVADDYLGNMSIGEGSPRRSFTMASDTRTDYLLRENELLRRQIERLRLQNAYMQKLLVKYRTISGNGRR